MKVPTFLLALASTLTIATAFPSICRNGVSRCRNTTTAVICKVDQEQLLFTCPEGQHCVMNQLRYTPMCKSPIFTSTPNAPPLAFMARKARKVAAALELTVCNDDPVKFNCTEGEYFCSSRTTASHCVNGTAQWLLNCPGGQHCYMKPGRPWPRCEFDKRDVAGPASTLAAVVVRDIPTSFSEPSDDVFADGICTPGELWSRRRDCYRCDNGKGKRIRHCQRKYTCRIQDNEAHCGRTGPNDDWKVRSTLDTAEIDGPLGEIKPVHGPILPSLIDRQESDCPVEGEEFCCGKYLACKCEDHFIWTIHECRSSSCVMDGDHAVCAAADAPSPTLIDAQVENTNDIPALNTRDDSSSLDIRAAIEDIKCGQCQSLNGGPQVDLMTSNNTCRNHPDLNGEYGVCKNEYCGLCIVFSQRNCQGDILWSGGPEFTQKTAHGRSHFCY